MKNTKYKFAFKEFDIWHQQAAMKICTDSCLFGAWLSPAAAMLDMGTGCGLLSLMVIQRVQAPATCLALEIDLATCQEARQNFENSPWKDSLNCVCADIHNFVPVGYGFDLVFSNPPFFCDSLPAGSAERRLAMHSSTAELGLWLAQMAKYASHLRGQVAVLLPAEALPLATSVFVDRFGLVPRRLAWVYQRPNKPAMRVMCQFGHPTAPTQAPIIAEHIYIHTLSGSYSAEFVRYLKPYYLAL